MPFMDARKTFSQASHDFDSSIYCHLYRRQYICSRCQETDCALCQADVRNCGGALLWRVHSARRQSIKLQCWIMPSHVSTLIATDCTIFLPLIFWQWGIWGFFFFLSSKLLAPLRENKIPHTLIQISHSNEVGNYLVFLPKPIKIHKKIS